MTHLSEHFSLEELTFSSTAHRLGIDNTPGLEVIAHLTGTAMGLEKIRKLLCHPMRIDSGYRCEELERQLTKKDFAAWCVKHGKSENDWPEYFARKGHPKGYAADFVCPKFGTPKEIVQLIQKAGIQVDQCIQEGAWVHVSFDPRMRNQFMTANFTNGSPTYTQGV